MGKGLSITAFVLSFIFPIVGLILGIVALSKSKNDPNALRGLAIAAIVIGGIFTLMGLISLIYFVSMWNQIRGTIESADLNQFALSAPLVASSFEIDPIEDKITFEIMNGDAKDITITKIKVYECSKDTMTVQPKAQISVGETASIYYQDEDCFEEDETFISSVTFYYTQEGSSIEFASTGQIFFI